MKSLVLSSPDLFDNSLAESIDQLPVRILLPGSGRIPEKDTRSPQYRLFKLHQAILQDHQKTWFQPISYKGQKPDLSSYEGELASIIDTMGEHWLVQDTLLCQLLPLWQAMVDTPLVFIYFSEPLECALALQSKWRFPISFGLALWESYMLSAARNIGDLSCIPVSYSKLRQSPVETMLAVRKQLELISDEHLRMISENRSRWASLEFHAQPDLSGHTEFLQDSQRAIYAHLKNGEFDQLRVNKLAPQSADILEYYSQLRAGYGILQAERKVSREPDSPIPDHQYEKEPAMTEQLQPGATTEPSAALLEVTVHIRGMNAVEFVVEADSPLLSMLARAMQASDEQPDELVYLDYSDNDPGALYFRRSSLIGFETSSVPC